MANEKKAGGSSTSLYVGLGVLALITVGIIAFVGFGGSDSSDNSDTVAASDDGDSDESVGSTMPSNDAAVPEGSGECSAVEYPGGELGAQDGLSDAVAVTRTKIAQAASACDYGALQSVMGSGFVWGFGPGETGTSGAIDDWKAREAVGEPVLLDLLEIIALDFAVADDGTYTFPAASQWKAPAWASASPEAIAALVSIYGQDNVDRWRAGTSFDGYRVGIRDNGGWYYFAGNEL